MVRLAPYFVFVLSSTQSVKIKAASSFVFFSFFFSRWERKEKIIDSHTEQRVVLCMKTDGKKEQEILILIQCLKISTDPLNRSKDGGIFCLKTFGTPVKWFS